MWVYIWLITTRFFSNKNCSFVRRNSPQNRQNSSCWGPRASRASREEPPEEEPEEPVEPVPMDEEQVPGGRFFWNHQAEFFC